MVDENREEDSVDRNPSAGVRHELQAPKPTETTESTPYRSDRDKKADIFAGPIIEELKNGGQSTPEGQAARDSLRYKSIQVELKRQKSDLIHKGHNERTMGDPLNKYTDSIVKVERMRAQMAEAATNSASSEALNRLTPQLENTNLPEVLGLTLERLAAHIQEAHPDTAPFFDLIAGLDIRLPLPSSGQAAK